jgi:hypothetical protein
MSQWWIQLLDSLFAGGSLSSGVMVLWIFPLAVIIRRILQLPYRQQMQLATVSAIAISVLSMFPLTPNSVVKTLFLVPFWILYHRSVIRLLVDLESCDVEMTSGWLCYCLCRSMLTQWVIKSNWVIFVSIVFIVTFRCAVYPLLCSCKFDVLAPSSRDIDGKMEPMKRTLRSKINNTPHMVAFGITVAIWYVLSRAKSLPPALPEVALCVLYFTAYSLITYTATKRFFSHNNIQSRLSILCQIPISVNRYTGEYAETSIQQFRLRTIRVLLLKEYVFQIMLLVGLLLLFWGKTIQGGLPMALFILPVAEIIANEGFRVFGQLIDLFIFSGRIRKDDTMDTGITEDDEKSRTFLEKMRDLFNPFTSVKKICVYIVTVVLILLAFMIRFDIINKTESFWWKIYDVLKDIFL